MEYSYSPVSISILIEQFFRGVGRAIVDDDQLKLYALLDENTIHCLAQITSAVVYAHHN
jgi:hypothetical protein